MKVCFIGLGSIGTRHLKNLVKIFDEYNLNLEVHALRRTQKPLSLDIKSLINHEVFNESDLCDDYDMTFITNPNNVHYDSIKLMANKTKSMFIEKPIFDNMHYDISKLNLRKNGIYYVAGPLKFSQVIQSLKKILVNESIYSIRAICSSYLPNWRKGVDYRNVYSAKKIQGGGVCIDLIHEWDYITYLFGFPLETFNINGKYSHLEIDSEDISIYIARYKDKLVEIHLDYFGRVPQRKIEIFTKNGTITGDFIRNSISFSDGRETIDFTKENKDMYVEEMKYFIDSVMTSQTGHSYIEHAYKVLKLAMGEIRI
ncbi:Gfo/Idh/MocA family oxidoreductase [Clostridium estertheticum]|uniref:Gfo/Idh/MocA family oxidoreductase n=1 Tax=Clostridium estertheticum TaxID=238834 RepID=UPI001CF2C8B0|nr:Gfo/Idh/MocA family oxidoreductase [Clostridium estertheticum]MCB2342097.1 Gfo/Idh/MocA family oxidoreductase [Clostridium estertheticum]